MTETIIALAMLFISGFGFGHMVATRAANRRLCDSISRQRPILFLDDLEDEEEASHAIH